MMIVVRMTAFLPPMIGSPHLDRHKLAVVTGAESA
jgi:hypothetical protein